MNPSWPVADSQATIIELMSSRRLQRVNNLVKQQVSEVIQELQLANCGFITVTSADVSSNLQDARIFVSVIGSEDKKERALTILDQRHAYIQHELAKRVVLKYTPRLRFLLDETESRARHIEGLLDELGHE